MPSRSVVQYFAIDAVAARGNDGQFSISLPASDPEQHRTFAQPKREKPKGEDATRIMIALAATRGSRRDAADFVARHYGTDGAVVARAERRRRAYTPDEVRAQLRERAAEAHARSDAPDR